ncbi:outer membrane lipoprotein carrier protein LolA [Paraglaciecola sp.]|uniref:outer membrane lipoprotein carrier protein LolA n=1 Tax=Paraglaciecola sp. TaxID=1920173 RepID=UPI0030F4A540
MKWITLFFLFFVCHIQIVTAAQTPFTWPSSTEQQGEFIQEKHLVVLTQPFITKGNYHYQQQTGLSWHTLHPIESEIKITREGVNELQADGSLKTLTNNALFSELLLALFSGEQHSLQQQFSLGQQQNTLTLIPKETQISKVILKITLHLENNVISQIVLHEPEGNYTNIFLSPSANKDQTSL